MATQTTTTSTNWLSTHWTWVLSHLLIVALIGGLVWGAVYGVDAMLARHDLATEQKYELILAKQTAVTKALEDKLDADTAQHAQEALAYQQQIAADQQAMKQRDALLATLVAKIGTMTPVQIQADLQPKLRQGTATALPDGVKLDTPAARDVDQQITEGANAKTDLAAAKTDLAAETKIASNATADLATAKQAITSEQGKNAAQVKACDTEKDTIRSDARKSKTKWAAIAGVIGFLIRVATHA
jgi:hypothetical protein